MNIVTLFFLIFLISCGNDNEVTDLGTTGSGPCINCKETGASTKNNTNQTNPTLESDSNVNQCSTPLTIEKINCVKFSTTYTGTLSYITANTDKEKSDCVKKYSVRTGGCAYRFIAPWLNNQLLSVCASPRDICINAKTAWQAKLEKLGYQCSSNTETINEGASLGGALSPGNTAEINCSEINSFEPFMNN